MRKKALLIEPNAYHGEILPGFTYLLQALDFEVDVLMRPEVLAEDPFSIYPKEKQPHLIALDIRAYKKYLLSQKNNYDLFFYSTSVLWDAVYGNYDIVDYLGGVIEGKSGSIYIEHNLSFVRGGANLQLMRSGRVATILSYKFDDNTTKAINPSYFGELKDTRPYAHTRTRILVLGLRSKSPETVNATVAAIRAIAQSRKVLFTVVNYSIEEINDAICCTGRLSFDEYYRLIREADYILNPFDDIPLEHDKYLNGTTSGAVQISIGFRKPLIIPSRHAEKYGFDEKVAILYRDSYDMDRAIARALDISERDWGAMEKRLSSLYNNVRDSSLNNLSEIISGLDNSDTAHLNRVIMEAIKLDKRVEYLEQIEKHRSQIEELQQTVKVLSKENQELRVHVNELWNHLHSKRFVVADKIYNKMNQIAPPGTYRRDILKFPYVTYHHVKNGAQSKYERQQRELQAKTKSDMIARAAVADKLIIYISMPWDNIMRQRPHHIAEQLSKQGIFVVYMDYEATQTRKINDNLYIVENQWCFDALKDVDVKKYFMLPAGYSFDIAELRKVIDRGYELIYEYIDELDETISGDLSKQKEVFNRLEDLQPALIITSARKLYNQMIERFDKKKVILNQNAVDLGHFNLNKSRDLQDVPDDLKPIVEKGQPIVGYYGAIAPWLDYDIINNLARKNPDISFIYIGVDYNGGLKNLLMYDNVRYLGPKSYSELPNYSRWFDAATIPFQQGEIAKSTSPVKLFEYMAMGLSVVCTRDLRECSGYEYVYLSDGENDFDENIRKAIKHKHSKKAQEKLHKQAESNTWKTRAANITERI